MYSGVMDLQPESSTRSSKDDFVVEKVLGSGTFGLVCLARRKQDGNLYALKQISLKGLTPAEQLGSVQEVQVLASLSSPHCIRYYDSFLHPPDAALYIVMEYADGGSLHDLISQSRQPLAEALIWRIALQLSLGLLHMHSKRILHRDVKSMNIFLANAPGGGQDIKIGDVGVAKVLKSNMAFAKTVIGTPYYLSPEICSSRPYDQRSDIWALGVVLYECCTRKHPFDAKSQSSLILKILAGKYAPITGYSQELVDVVKRCLTQSAARRPTAAGLLSLPAMRAKASELGIELPADLPPAPAPAPAKSEAGVPALGRPPAGAGLAGAGGGGRPAAGVGSQLRAPRPPTAAARRPSAAGPSVPAPGPRRRASCPGISEAPAARPPSPAKQVFSPRDRRAPKPWRVSADGAAKAAAPAGDRPAALEPHAAGGRERPASGSAAPKGAAAPGPSLPSRQSVFVLPLGGLSSAAREWLAQRRGSAPPAVSADQPAAKAAAAGETPVREYIHAMEITPPLIPSTAEEGTAGPTSTPMVEVERSSPSLQSAMQQQCSSSGPMHSPPAQLEAPCSGIAVAAGEPGAQGACCRQQGQNLRQGGSPGVSLAAGCWESSGNAPLAPRSRRASSLLEDSSFPGQGGAGPCCTPEPEVWKFAEPGAQPECIVERSSEASEARAAAAEQRRKCQQVLGEALFEQLWQLVQQGGTEGSSRLSLGQLGSALFLQAGYDKAEGIHALFKLLYLEAQA